jgi:hypothetical protein
MCTPGVLAALLPVRSVSVNDIVSGRAGFGFTVTPDRTSTLLNEAGQVLLTFDRRFFFFFFVFDDSLTRLESFAGLEGAGLWAKTTNCERTNAVIKSALMWVASLEDWRIVISYFIC